MEIKTVEAIRLAKGVIAAATGEGFDSWLRLLEERSGTQGA